MTTAPAANLAPTILAGGSGTRLWPVSRAAFPKHLVELFDEESLLQTTVRRALAVAPPERVITVAAAGQGVLIRRQYQAIDPRLQDNLLLEPSARNTAAAVALACLHAQARFGPETILWVCPSDHLMLDVEALQAALRDAIEAAAQGWLVTFGINPSRAETGFGWIAPAEPLPGTTGVLRVEKFVEKPKPAAAEELLATGTHLWNSGMFVFQAQRMLAELERWAADILTATRAAYPDGAGPIDAAAYARIRAQPIDKAVMEHSPQVAVVPADPRWSDVGSWHALWELMAKDEAGNARQGDTIALAARDNLIRSEKRLVAVAGVNGLAVIETADALLVVDRQNSEAVRSVVDALVKSERREAATHAREMRPWGQFTVLQEEVGYKVKVVVVDGHGQLTFQYHPGRDETWVIVEGEALVERDGETLRLRAGQTLTVPRGTRHRLSNPGAGRLKLIEIGCGEALGDDDTVRLDG
ncbi:MAG: mannose-1-phosphate guanylyltransferase/mannose-6-phosphate isomerase [Geminicoccaceae bacterium]